MKIIIDSRMRTEEKAYLSQYGDLIEIQPQEYVYEEISGHPDIFFCKINNTLFECPNIGLKIGKIGNLKIENEYPKDIRYNICQIGKYVIHNFNYTDKTILEYINNSNLEKINIKQGYSNCSISVLSDNSCITSDKKINKILKAKNINSLYVSNKHIHLLTKNKFMTNMEGFIGGASCVINNTFILFGDSKYLENNKELIKFINKQKLSFKEFKNLEIIDYGGIITI